MPPPKQKELWEAADFYHHKEPAIEQPFFDEVEMNLTAISNYPKSFPVVLAAVRKKVLSRFPFALMYREEPKRIFILAVMHQRRKPDYWKKRL